MLKPCAAGLWDVKLRRPVASTESPVGPESCSCAPSTPGGAPAPPAVEIERSPPKMGVSDHACTEPPAPPLPMRSVLFDEPPSPPSVDDARDRIDRRADEIDSSTGAAALRP